MIYSVFFFTLLCAVASEERYYPFNVSRTTLSGIAEYRSALTLDWLAAEDTRQRELALAFETESVAPIQVIASDCISYPKPASGKVARLMLELLKNLEGDEGTIISELTQGLMRAKLLVETSMMDAEPSLESLVETPDLMMGEPHATFPRILAMVWMTATDPTTVNKIGWCPINKIAKYLTITQPKQIASHMREIDPVVARARFVMEDFIQHVTPNVYDKNNRLLMRTSAMNERRMASRTSNQIFGRSQSLKVHVPPYSTNKTNTSNWATIGSVTLPINKNDYVEHKHVLVNNPTFEDEMTSNGRRIADFRITLWLTFCDILGIFVIY